MVHDLLRTQGVDINTQDGNGFIALSIAVAKGNLTIIQLILKHEAVDVNLVTYAQAFSALAIAASKNDCIIVRLLLDHGADAGHCDNHAGGSAVDRAVGCGVIPVVKLMLKHHTKFGNVDDNGRNLVHWASAEGCPGIVDMLHDEGLETNYQDKIGSTPLHEASRHGNIEATDALLQLGVIHLLKTTIVN